MPTIFTVQGPLEIPVYSGKGGRTITPEDISAFWATNKDVQSAYGCYVFAIRAGKGYTPGYVGQAKKTFKQELFAPHKLAKYQQFLADYAKGTPVLFLIACPVKKGARNLAHIADLEDFLIQTAVSVNPDLLNIQGTAQADWGISGVLRAGQGKRSIAATEFMRCLKM